MAKSSQKLHALAQVYLSVHVSNLKTSHKTSQVITRDVLPHLPNKKIHKINRGHVGKMLIEHQHRVGTRALAFRNARAMFNWLENYGLSKHNPMHGMRSPTPPRPRERFLSDNEIKILWKAIDRRGLAFSSLYKLGILTGQRRGELAHMLRDEVNGDWWAIPASKTKNGREHEVYLSPLAKTFLHDGPYLTNPLGHKPLTGSTYPHRRILDCMGDDVPHWVFHDLRHTVKTGMASLGVIEDVRDRVLNHRSGQSSMDKVYNHYTYKKERHKALLDWSDHVWNLINSTVEVN